jgi:small-conductance mechanosensitive channel
MLLIGPISFSQFEKDVILSSILGYIVYLLAILIIRYRLKQQKKGKTRGKFSYNFVSLLKSIYDMAFLFMIATSFCMTAIQIAIQLFGSYIVVRLSLIALMVFVIFLIFLSPKIINFRSIDRPERGNKYLPLALAVAGAAPGLGILISYLFSDDPFLYFIFISSTILVVLILPVVIINLYEVVLLVACEWPELKKTGAQWEIVDYDR